MSTGDPNQREITVYTAPYCVLCEMVKEYLQRHGVEFAEVNVSQDSISRQRMVAGSGQEGVPVVEINGVMIVGFDKEKLADILGFRTDD
ncbi:MAG: hypothetical protein A3I44_04215 [Candidatus Sungbacteria bacterium RIFCSPLOWO2_02_FULL_51_17]|uniref:Glutaredoxin domain-containing protein n=1 Tax=Candidatus Sungbacteria bacterium RIFCSPHIGHO2_02_FULL_51_29 TaxID=1802273 RepID=A0A1G2KW77_9BACT|nr:MAG: hypothetical protein A2676_02725 [Candidatus Sungbacteria bacterium RIFCSPHIGHO2_01_FULL_51_22]OHA03697.1 MAG: hypothetical protein A3C16_03615 [Candidatus Sungbacteria bacterium RIFCSPHIGHO2_02_FULL_51_29]OHA07319.1 MAG: hypothetical protein A3B29_02820 [Candidatus Sungbacteria bacterium RIFCSPLOWO2_01_FULL_51_34]OHA11282.1 MAG: hypothetical protein A3I44_04215 [Candidatus Sungbacteria bacterium RIFCSPLOWO2_02_FULL_51_17]